MLGVVIILHPSRGYFFSLTNLIVLTTFVFLYVTFYKVIDNIAFEASMGKFFGNLYLKILGCY